jgi:hypothetical protein
MPEHPRILGPLLAPCAARSNETRRIGSKALILLDNVIRSDVREGEFSLATAIGSAMHKAFQRLPPKRQQDKKRTYHGGDQILGLAADTRTPRVKTVTRSKGGTRT